VVMAETFVAMPFLIITVEGALRSADQGFEEAAATLGAKRMTVFRRVTVPMVAPSLGAGAVLCWARALGEFGATIMVAGNIPGKTQTIPLAIYFAAEANDLSTAGLYVIIISLITFSMIFWLNSWGRRKTGASPAGGLF
ncbi:MAG: ABC transporter permease subunit, partial [Negativicutes bacterium]|nr:ABC transporter permease subunit [Negativicutes bacterium]